MSKRNSFHYSPAGEILKNALRHPIRREFKEAPMCVISSYSYPRTTTRKEYKQLRSWERKVSRMMDDLMRDPEMEAAYQKLSDDLGFYGTAAYTITAKDGRLGMKLLDYDSLRRSPARQ